MKQGTGENRQLDQEKVKREVDEEKEFAWCNMEPNVARALLIIILAAIFWETRQSRTLTVWLSWYSCRIDRWQLQTKTQSASLATLPTTYWSKLKWKKAGQEIIRISLYSKVDPCIWKRNGEISTSPGDWMISLALKTAEVPVESSEHWPQPYTACTCMTVKLQPSYQKISSNSP